MILTPGPQPELGDSERIGERNRGLHPVGRDPVVILPSFRIDHGIEEISTPAKVNGRFLPRHGRSARNGSRHGITD